MLISLIWWLIYLDFFFIYIPSFMSLQVLCMFDLWTYMNSSCQGHYFPDSSHAFFFFFQIFTSLTLRCVLPSIPSSVYNWQHFFLLFGTENNRTFNNPWHLSQRNMILTLFQPFSFQIVFMVTVSFSFLFFCVPPFILSSPCLSPIFNYPLGRIYSLLQFHFAQR